MQQGYSAIQRKGSPLQGPGTASGRSSSWHSRAVLCSGVDGGTGFCSAPPAHQGFCSAPPARQAALCALVKLTALVNLWVVLIGRAKWVQFPKT